MRRHRQFLTSTILGLWLFALFVGIANACNWNDVSSMPHHPTLATHAVDDAMDEGIAPGCDEFCSNDVPVLRVVKLVQVQPAEQPLILALHHSFGVLPISTPVLFLAWNAHPPPGVPFFRRSVRLTL